jgi:hypothetical protein
VSGVRFVDRTRLEWTPAAGPGAVHDVPRGFVHELPVGRPGASEMCVAAAVPEASAHDDAVPEQGRSFWYLVRGRSLCGTGTYGTARDGTPRVTTVCP